MNALNRAPIGLRRCRCGGLEVLARPALTAAVPRAPAPALALPPASALASRPVQGPNRTTPFARPFSQTTTLEAKGKNKRGKAKTASAAENNDAEAEEGGEDAAEEKEGPFDREAAFDLADVDDAYKKLEDRFENKLMRYKVGTGRFNPDLLGSLRVRTAKDSAAEYPLRELAEVVHQGGRNVSILVSEAAYIKPIMSAVQKSEDFNQQPQRAPDNDLELLLRIEPENPDEQARHVRDMFHDWRTAVRKVMDKRAKKHALWTKKRHIVPDDRKKLDNAVKVKQDGRMVIIDKREKKILQDLASRTTRI